MATFLKEYIQTFKWNLFQLYLALRVHSIRRNKIIRFGFLLQELTQWKTEALYKAMLAHPRFVPVLCISPSLGYPGAEVVLENYCIKKGYSFVWLDPDKTIHDQVELDMVVPEKPYQTEMWPLHQPDKNRRIPYVVIPYYLRTIVEEWTVDLRINNICWKQFLDNDSCYAFMKNRHRLKGRNFVITGLPLMDDLLSPKEVLSDIWPIKDGRKRIIYAPHHSIGDMHWEGIGYSTFLEYCDLMLYLRGKYNDRVYFVFKPHPSLRIKLQSMWGKEKTDSYYNAWNCPGVSHVEEGEYLALFKYSDAMIHDCASFTVEYIYTGNPVMYLVRYSGHADNMLPHAKEAFNLHYKGFSANNIEQFIVDVINGNDPLKDARKSFLQKSLIPPYGKSASINIINAILGIEDYK